PPMGHCSRPPPGCRQPGRPLGPQRLQTQCRLAPGAMPGVLHRPNRTRTPRRIPRFCRLCPPRPQSRQGSHQMGV
ncbi:hypothetical protein H0H87_004042, partial [Tephrocybe sp. NHM501043]